MHETGAREGDHLGLLLADTRKRRRPFARTAERIDLSTGIDHAAIHQAGHDRRQLAGDAGEHGLVQALQARDDIALMDERAALPMTGGRDEVGIVEALTDRGGLAGSGMCRRRLAVTQLLLGDGEQE